MNIKEEVLKELEGFDTIGIQFSGHVTFLNRFKLKHKEFRETLKMPYRCVSIIELEKAIDLTLKKQQEEFLQKINLFFEKEIKAMNETSPKQKSIKMTLGEFQKHLGWVMMEQKEALKQGMKNDAKTKTKN